MNWTQLRKQITDDFNAAIARIDWLEAYEKRIANNAQTEMTDVVREAQAEKRKKEAAAKSKNKAAMMEEALKEAGNEFTTEDLIGLCHAKYPSVKIEKKYAAFFLYKKDKDPKSDVKLLKKGAAGMPNRYTRKISRKETTP